MSEYEDDDAYERAEAEAAAIAARGQLLVIQVDGTTRMVPCRYEGIRDGVGDTAFDFVRGVTVGAYIDDEGMLNGSPLNVPLSITFGRPLYGPGVLCAASPDGFGNTLPPPDEAVASMRALGIAWHRVVTEAVTVGQNVMIHANADTIPPPTVVALTEEAFSRWLETGEMPS